MKVYNCKTDSFGFYFPEFQENKEIKEESESHPIDESSWQTENFPH
jgi:hypothetical protein